jgi:hypothetical protein
MANTITRTHGAVALPSQRPSAISFYTITFAADVTTTASVDLTTPWVAQTGNNSKSDVGVVNGALDRVFKLAIPTVATVAMIGTVGTTTVRFAIEDTGADTYSPSYLGMGSSDNSPATTALAFQAAIRTLGTVNNQDLASATVAGFTL